MAQPFNKINKMHPLEVSILELPVHLRQIALERLKYMTPQEFCYWLQGFFENAKPTEINAEQTTTIMNHLNLVFAHSIDPQAGGPAVQSHLTNIHNGGPGGPKIRC
jgi:hypothetical protein